MKYYEPVRDTELEDVKTLKQCTDWVRVERQINFRLFLMMNGSTLDLAGEIETLRFHQRKVWAQ